jgi:hypothetical protein
MKAYDDGEQGMEFTSFGNGGGVHVDLGHTESFNLKIQKFETGDVPNQDDLLTRTIGPIRGLTNRPPPPVLDALLLHGTSDGSVEVSADFNNIGAPTTHVLVYNHGTLVAERTGVWSQLGEPVLVLPEWPLSLGKLGRGVTCRSGTTRPGPIRVPGGGGLGLLATKSAFEEIVLGDEFRILAELPSDAPHPDFYSSFEFLASDGPTWRVSGVERTVVCPTTAVNIVPGPGGLLITWPGENFTLQGAEKVRGPWFDLGVESPVSLLPNHPARFFRLLCD